MAKRRINKPLAVTLGVVVAVLTAAFFVGAYVLKERLGWFKDPQPYIEAAERFETAGEFEKAIDSYRRAFSYERNRQQKESWGIRAGDLLWVSGREEEALGFYLGILKYYSDSVPGQSRAVQLMMYRAGLSGSEPGWTQLAEEADRLIQRAPTLPLGHRLAGLARFHINRPAYRKQALEHFARLRELDPADPAGYFYAAVILLAAPEHGDPSGPRRDIQAADKLMEFTPADAPPATLSRFRLYQGLYLNGRPPEGIANPALKPEERVAIRRAQQEKVKAVLGEVADRSAMTRNELFRLADLCRDLGLREQAEQIYLSWGNDRAETLRELVEPPARQVSIDRLTQQSPNSLSGCVHLASLFLAWGKLDQVDVQVELGLSLPTVAKGWLGEVHKNQRCELMLIRARRLLAEADRRRERSAYLKVEQSLREAAGQYPQQTENMADFQRLSGEVAFRLGRLYAAQGRLERALDLLEQRDPARTVTERAEIALRLVDTYRGLSQFGSARDLLNRKVLNSPQLRDLVVVQRALAYLHADLREFAQSNTVIDELLAEEPVKNSPDLVRELRQLKAINLDRMGKPGEAVAELAKIEGVAGTPAQLCREGMVALSEKREPDAIAKFRQALDADPKLWMAADLLSRVHFQNDRKPEAEQTLTEFLAANPDHQMAKIALARVKEGTAAAVAMRQDLIEKSETPVQREVRLANEAVENKDKDSAYRHLDEAEGLAEDPAGKTTVQVAGFSLSLAVRDFPRARRYLEKLEAADADGVGGLSYRARMLQAEGQYAKAIQAFREVLTRRQADSLTRRLLARALLESGEGTVAEAAELLRQSIKDNPLDAESWRDLVQVLHRSRRTKEAWSEAERGLAQLGGDAYLFQVNLERLEAEEPARAIREREQIASRFPNEWRNAFALARLYARQNQPAKAEDLVMQTLSKVDEKDRLQVVLLASEFFRLQRAAGKGEKILDDYLASHPDSPDALLAKGEYLRMLGRHEEAEPFFKKAVEKAPDNPSVYLSVGEFYRSWSKPAQALEAVRQAQAKASQPFPEIHRRLVSYQIEFGQLAAAGESIAQFKAAWPGNPDGDLLEGYLCTRQGQFDRAIAAFDRIIQKRPEAALAYYRKAQALYRANPGANLASVITNTQTALDYDPNLLDGQPWFELAELYLQRREPFQAVAIYRRLLERNPHDVMARVLLLRVLNSQRQEGELDREMDEARRLFPDVPQFHVEFGHVAMRRNQPAQAEGYYRQAMRLAPKAEPPALGLVGALGAQNKWQAVLDESPKWLADIGEKPRLYLARARALERLNQKEPMLGELEKAVDASGGLPALLWELAGEVKNTMGPEQAEKWLSGYVAKHPDDVGPRLIRAHFWSAIGKLNEAVADLKALAQAHSQASDQAAPLVRFNLAIIYQQNERYRDAADYFKQVLDLTGDAASPVVLNNYAYLLADNLNDPVPGIPLAEKAAEATNRTDANILDTLGWCHVKAGQVQKGLDILEEARRKEELPIVYYHLARGYQALMQTENARRMAEQAAQLARDKDPRVEKLAQDLLRQLGR